MGVDVLIVGYGPVGQVLSILLAQRGWSVAVLERHRQPYPMPRAVAFDGEAARILAAAGIADFIADFGENSGDYTWRTANEEILLASAAAARGWCGWPDSISMYQPGLESALIARGAALSKLHVYRGYEAVEMVPEDDHVRVGALDSAGDRLELSARYVVGCDGANSFVRECMGSQAIDLGFSFDWLICDGMLHEPREFKPNNLQICDPARPRTAVSAGPGHRRWEFMRLPGEPPEEFGTVENAWRLLELFDVYPHNATLDRYAVYAFEARRVERWRSGRMVLAGDAAHLMPPFAGQGMSSGFRDAANLAWKLDLILSGLAGERLLDSYTVERGSHVRHAIELSVNLGKIICEIDPEAAADRHAVLVAAREHGLGRHDARRALHPLDDGLLHRKAAGGAPKRPAGELSPQGRVARGTEIGLLDEVVGTGFVLVSSKETRSLLDADTVAFLDGIGARHVRMLPVDTPAGRLGEHSVIDMDDVYLSYLRESEALCMLVRPDSYLFGTARDRDELVALVGDLSRRLRSGAVGVGAGPPGGDRGYAGQL